MKVLICGSREFDNYILLREVLNSYVVDLIIHGAAKGADSLADKYATEKEISVKMFPAEWGMHGKAAGPIRNQQMLDQGSPDLVLAFWNGQSRGTFDMIERATKQGFTVRVVRYCE